MRKRLMLLVIAMSLAVPFGTAQQTKPRLQRAQATTTSDRALEQQVRAKLSSDPAFTAVKVHASRGNVELSGIVPSTAEQQRAIDLVKSIAGVQNVADRTSIGTAKAAAVAADPAATTGNTSHRETQNNTAGSIAGNSGAIGATTGDTRPTNSNVTQQSAEGQSAPPSGQQSVNDVQNKGGAAGAATSGGNANAATPNSGAVASSAGAGNSGAGSWSVGQEDATTLQQQLESALKSDPTTANSQVQVQVSDSEITLNGTVQSGKEKTTAERIAQSYGSNRRVVNKLTVQVGK